MGLPTVSLALRPRARDEPLTVVVSIAQAESPHCSLLCRSLGIPHLPARRTQRHRQVPLHLGLGNVAYQEVGIITIQR